jgi:hypothetical protein
VYRNRLTCFDAPSSHRNEDFLTLGCQNSLFHRLELNVIEQALKELFDAMMHFTVPKVQSV